MRRLLFIALLLGFVTASVDAKQIGGVNLPNTLQAGAKDLVLNGAGFRTKWMFKIYVGGLYLLQKEREPQKIIIADEPMVCVR